MAPVWWSMNLPHVTILCNWKSLLAGMKWLTMNHGDSTCLLQPSTTIESVGTRTAVQSGKAFQTGRKYFQIKFELLESLVTVLYRYIFVIHLYIRCSSWGFCPLIFRSFPNNYWDKFVKRKVGDTVFVDLVMSFKHLPIIWVIGNTKPNLFIKPF